MSIPHINLTNNTLYSVDRIILTKLLDSVSQYEKELTGKEISIYLVDNQEINKLNKRYFGRDEITDILTFNSEFKELPYLGEIIINLERIMKEEENEPLEQLSRLIIHGILHLLGYDHINTREKHKMTTRESFLIKKIMAKGE